MKRKRNTGKRLCALLCATVLGATLVGCGGGVKQLEKETEVKGYTVVYPEKIEGALHNPGMGWVALEEQTYLGKPDLGASGTLPEIDNIGMQTSWAQIERTPGVFDWSLIDKTIEYWSALGKRINFRICTDSLSLPEVYFGAPQWLYEAPYNVSYKEYAYGSTVNVTRVTDLTDPIYQQYFERFLEKLSERYADCPYLETVDIRGFGQWGEWHSGHSFADMDERIATLSYIVDKYVEAFDKNGIELLLSCSWDFQGSNDDGSSAVIDEGRTTYEDFIRQSAFDYAAKLPNVGYRRDGGAGNGVVKYNYDERLMTEFFRSGKKTSLVGEFFTDFANYLPNENGVLQYGMDPVEAVDEIFFKMRANYSTAMGWTNIVVADIVEKGYEAVFNRGNEIMGYRFAVDSARWPQSAAAGTTATVLTQISNAGTGRLTLKDHALKIALTTPGGKEVASTVNRDFDLRTLTAGEILNVYTDIAVPESLSGQYNVVASIVDGNGNPAIRLAQTGDYNRRLYTLGTIDIVNKVKMKAVGAHVEALGDYRFKSGNSYAVTFRYRPSFALSDFRYGTDDGYFAEQGGQRLVNWRDVSGESAYKTIVFTAAADGTMTVGGTGDYADTIDVGDAYIESLDGYYETFDDYDPDSLKSPFYAVLDSTGTLENGAFTLTADGRHQRNDLLTSDGKILKLAPNTAYTVSFDTQATRAGGNGAYMYLDLRFGGGQQRQNVSEWYIRPYEGKQTLTFTFITPDAGDSEIVFGMKNAGAYTVDNLLITRGANGSIVKGIDVGYENNVLPDYSDKGIGVVEDFESRNFNASTMKYGFDRLGAITTDPNEVIGGYASFSSRVDPYAVPFYDNDGSCWIEFSYSNPYIVTLKPQTVYRITFKYRVVEAPESAPGAGDGHFYALLRSNTLGYGGDSKTTQFGKTVTDGVATFTADMMTGDATDYYVVLGMFQAGVLVYDDFLIEEVGALGAFDGEVDFENGNATISHVEYDSSVAGIVDLTDEAYQGLDAAVKQRMGNYAMLCDSFAGAEWNEFFNLASTAGIKPNAKYTISFDYYVLDVGDNAYVQNFARPSSGVSDDVHAPNYRLEIETGDSGTYTGTFETLDKSNYRWTLGSHNAVKVLIDNIKLVEVTE